MIMEMMEVNEPNPMEVDLEWTKVIGDNGK